MDRLVKNIRGEFTALNYSILIDETIIDYPYVVYYHTDKRYFVTECASISECEKAIEKRELMLSLGETVLN